MSLLPSVIGPVPEQTACIARVAFPKGNLYFFLLSKNLDFWTTSFYQTKRLFRLIQNACAKTRDFAHAKKPGNESQ